MMTMIITHQQDSLGPYIMDKGAGVEHGLSIAGKVEQNHAVVGDCRIQIQM